VILIAHATKVNLSEPNWIVSDVVEKNIDSSSKSNLLRRCGKNYDASTWRRMASSSKKIKSTKFQQKFVWITYSN